MSAWITIPVQVDIAFMRTKSPWWNRGLSCQTGWSFANWVTKQFGSYLLRSCPERKRHDLEQRQKASVRKSKAVRSDETKLANRKKKPGALTKRGPEYSIPTYSHQKVTVLLMTQPNLIVKRRACTKQKRLRLRSASTLWNPHKPDHDPMCHFLGAKYIWICF